VLRYLYRRGQLRGLFGGSRGWTVVWAVIFSARMLKKASTREPEVVYSEILGPGETVILRNEEPAPTKRQERRRGRRSRRQDSGERPARRRS
jgi:hypothetical protein